MHLCSELWQSLTLCSPVLAWPSPCRSFWSDKTLHQVHMQYYFQTSSLCQELLQVMYHLFLHQTCATQTLWTSQAPSNSQEALEFVMSCNTCSRFCNHSCHLYNFQDSWKPSSMHKLSCYQLPTWILFIVNSHLLFSSDPATMCSLFMYISH